MEAPNVLLLDEPTNDLDVMTLSILEDYLQSFPGPIITVSHDRFLLDKLADQIFQVKGGGAVEIFTGNWSDWMEKRKTEQAVKVEKPKVQTERVREKKLKFSFKEEREFATIDEDIAALEAAIEENQAAQEAAGADFVKLQQLQEELTDLEALYRSITGEEMAKFYRPPQGIYSKDNLRYAKELGYKTVFWSLAYVDWNNDKQPSAEAAFSKLLPRIHNGAVVLLHSTSQTNAEIMDDLLTRWEEMGYRFESIDKLFS
jgi:ABC-type sugar transport system ATPase subunit